MNVARRNVPQGVRSQPRSGLAAPRRPEPLRENPESGAAERAAGKGGERAPLRPAAHRIDRSASRGPEQVADQFKPGQPVVFEPGRHSPREGERRETGVDEEVTNGTRFRRRNRGRRSGRGSRGLRAGGTGTLRLPGGRRVSSHRSPVRNAGQGTESCGKTATAGEGGIGRQPHQQPAGPAKDPSEDSRW